MNCKICKDQGYYFPDKNSDLVLPCNCLKKEGANEIHN